MRVKRRIISILLSVLLVMTSMNINFKKNVYADDNDICTAEVSSTNDLLLSNGTADYDAVLETQEVEQERYLEATATDVNQSLVKVISDAMYSGSQEMNDISSFNATVTDYKNAYAIALRKNMLSSNATESGGFSYSYSYSGTKIYGFQLRYSGTQESFTKRRNEIQDKVDQIVSSIPSSMTSEEKALFVHDYLVYNCEYDYENYLAHTIPMDSYVAYGALVKGVCVCAGYAQAFSIIMDQMGIESEYVVSDAKNHAWNLVKLDGEWYHADATFDDPIFTSPMYDRLGYVRHTYFLLNDAEMHADDGHSSWNDGFPASTSTKYSNSTIHNVGSNCVYSNGNWYYVYNGNLYKGSIFNTIPGTKINVGKSLSLLGGFRDKFLFVYNGTIFLVNADGTNLVDVSSQAGITGYVSEAMINDAGNIRYSLSGSGTQYQYTIPMNVNVTDVKLNKSVLAMKPGDQENLTATVTPADATNSKVTWKTSNTSVATVSDDGLVTAVGTGTATITVTTVDGGKTATCNITVKAPLSASLTVDKNETTVGNTINLKVAATGGSGNNTYTCVVHNITTGSWTQLETNNTGIFAHTIGTAGTREYYVAVQDGAGTKVKTNTVTVVTTGALTATLKLNGSTAQINNVAGNTVNIVTTATGGSGNNTYTCVVHNITTGSWTQIGTNTTGIFSHTIGSAGSREYYVSVQDAAGTKIKTNTVTVVTTGALTATLKLNGSTAQINNTVGNTVNIVTSTTGGSGNKTYIYVVHNITTGSWTQIGTNNTGIFSHTIGSAGTREYYVAVQDAAGTKVKTNAIKVITTGALTATLKLNGSTAQINNTVGNTVNIATTTTGGNGSNTYKCVVHNVTTESWTQIGENSTGIFNHVIGSAGTREYYVSVQDASGTKVKTNIVKVVTSSPIVATLKLNGSMNTINNVVGNAVNIVASLSGESESSTFKYIVHNLTTGTWSQIGENTTGVLTHVIGSTGTREYYVAVQNISGTVVKTNIVQVITK